MMVFLVFADPIVPHLVKTIMKKMETVLCVIMRVKPARIAKITTVLNVQMG